MSDIVDISSDGIIPLNWKNGFEKFKMMRIPVAGDGSCFFHCICKAFFIPYITGIIDGSPISKKQIVTSLRMDLSNALASKINNKSSMTHYDSLSRNELKNFSKNVPEYTLSAMQTRLNSDSSIGNEFNEFISNQIAKDIYLLDNKKKDVYITGDEDELLYKNRNSIVILYTEGHYELIGLMENNGHISTYFVHTHPFIQFIRQRTSIIKKQKINNTKI